MAEPGLKELRAEIERKQREGVKRYGAELRERALGYLRAREGEGATSWIVSQELGLRWQTLQRWRAVPGRGGSVDFRRVAVEPEGSRGGVVVHGAHGVRVEGLGLAEVVTLLRALG